ncbi:MAG: AIPR family protein [Chthoniobacter sp.]|nr:AIPR family protein [Chthoniobacter sp.]
MKLTDFAENYHQQVLARCAHAEDGQMREEAFTEEVLEDLTEAGEVSEAEMCYFRSKGKKGVPATKLNACCFSGDGSTLDLFVSIYRGSGEAESVTASEVVEHFDLARGFLLRARSGFHTQLEEASEVFDVARRIHEQSDALSVVRIFLLTDGVAKLPSGAKFEAKPVDELELRPVLWDIAKLHQFHESGRQRDEITIDFAGEQGGAIPCLGEEDATKEYWTFLAFFPGPVLASIYGEHGPRLLERNVRSFLQVRGNVNKGIQKTIAETPHRFLAYNNGISATAKAVDLEQIEKGLYRLNSATDFQIVNGGQTTASLFHAWKKEKCDISQVVVQVKLTLAREKARLDDFVPHISKYANSQNKVNTADFSANGPFHQRLEELSRTTVAPAVEGLERGTRWYYERARGSYLDEKSRAGTPGQIRQWEREHPIAQKFTKTDLAKFENTWEGLPHLVSRGAEKNFGHWTATGDEVGMPIADEQYFKRLAAKAILFRRTEQIVAAQGYPGYRANIVTYSLAWLVRRSGRRIPLDEIWRAQALPTRISTAIDAVAHAARKHITNPPGGRNITEWCKKEECWTAFSAGSIDLPRGWESELADEPMSSPVSEGDLLGERWERVRQTYIEDPREIGELAARAKVKWPALRWQHAVSDYAKLTWPQLQAKRAFGLAKQRAVLEMLEVELARSEN